MNRDYLANKIISSLCHQKRHHICFQLKSEIIDSDCEKKQESNKRKNTLNALSDSIGFLKNQNKVFRYLRAYFIYILIRGYALKGVFGFLLLIFFPRKIHVEVGSFDLMSSDSAPNSFTSFWFHKA